MSTTFASVGMFGICTNNRDIAEHIGLNLPQEVMRTIQAKFSSDKTAGSVPVDLASLNIDNGRNIS